MSFAHVVELRADPQGGEPLLVPAQAHRHFLRQLRHAQRVTGPEGRTAVPS